MAVTRTCVGCRQRDTTDHLVRVVRDAIGIRADESGTAPGRGAYVHRRLACLEKSVARKALARALRAPMDVPAIGILDLAD